MVAPATRSLLLPDHPRYEQGDILESTHAGQLLRVHDRLRQETVALRAQRLSSVPRGGIEVFRRLFARLRSLEHPHLPQVFDLGTTESVVFYTRELLPHERRRGRPLANGPSGPHVADEHMLRQCLASLASALAALHAAGLVHGLIIPRHVQVTIEKGRVAGAWLTEVGFHSLVPPQFFALNRRYLAPEIRSGGRPSPASDIFGLGMVFLDALESGTAKRRRSSRLPARGPDVGAEVRAFLRELAAPDPARRPADGEVLRQRLRDPVWALPAPTSTGDDFLSPSLVGRAKTLAVLDRLLASAAEGEARAALLVGETGSGRSRLVEWLAAKAAAAGWATARVSAERGAGGLEALGRIVSEALGLSATMLAPDACLPVPGYAQLSAAIIRELKGAGVPLLVLADDADQLPPDVRVALCHLAVEAGRLPLLVLGAGHTPESLPGAKPIPVGRLQERDLRRLLAPLLAEAVNPEAIFAAVAREADGNPLQVRILLRAWLEAGRLRFERGRPVFDEGGFAEAPIAMESAIRGLVERLDARERALVELLAVWEPLPAGAAETALGGPVAVPETLVERMPGDMLRLASDSIAPVIRNMLSAERRRSLHESILAALAGPDVAPGLRAPHLVATGRTLEAVRDLVAAGEQAVKAGAIHAALESYRAALAQTPALEPGAIDRNALALAAAKLALHVGELTRSRAALVGIEAPEAEAECDPARRFEILLVRAQILRERRLTAEAAAAFAAARALAAAEPALAPELIRVDIEEAANDCCAGRWEIGVERLRPRLAALEAAGGPPRALALALKNMSMLLNLGGEGRDAALHAARAARVARTAGDSVLQSRALVNLGYVYHRLSLPARALRSLDRARVLLARCPHEGLRASELTHRGQVLIAHGDFAAAETALLHARAIRLRTGDHGRLPAILIDLGRLRRHRGQLNEAASSYEQALAIAEEFELPAAHTARGNLAELLLYQGEIRSAERLFRAALSDPRRETRGLCFCNLATLYRREGRFPEAIAALAESERLLSGLPALRAHAVIEAARVHLAAGVTEAAELRLAEMADDVESADPETRAGYHLARGLVQSRGGGGARSAFDAAIAAARETGDPTFRACVLVDALHAAATAAEPDAPWLRARLDELTQVAVLTDARAVASEVAAVRGEVVSRFPPPRAGDELAARFVQNVVEQGRSAEETLLGELVSRLGGGGALLLAVGLTPEGKLNIAPVPALAEQSTTVRPYRVAAREFDRRILRQALAATGGNVPEAARLLCLPESTFRYRASKLKLLGRAARETSSSPS